MIQKFTSVLRKSLSELLLTPDQLYYGYRHLNVKIASNLIYGKLIIVQLLKLVLKPMKNYK